MKTKTAMVVVMAVAFGIGLVQSVYGDVSVEDMKCTQRYPWNGLVDIEYTIACDDPEAEIYVNAVGFNGDTGLTVFPTHFTGDGATNTVKAGKHTMVWDARADLGNLFATKNFQIKMYAGKKLSRYIVIDISGGADAEDYPVRYSVEGPNIADDTCRTTEIWMRLIPPGTFMMGSPADELGRDNGAGETLSKVHVTKPFYIGVFEVTEGQFSKVYGVDSSSTCPQANITSADIWRPHQYWVLPSSMEAFGDSFIGKLRARTKKYGFCLPSEAQWEYACRAGTTTALYSGHNLTSVNGDDNLSNIARYKVNGSSPAPVGSYEPNALGLYDMLGNVCERCRDFYRTDRRSGEMTDPIVEEGGNYVYKGGNYGDLSFNCRSATRHDVDAAKKQPWLGFRLCATGDLQ